MADNMGGISNAWFIFSTKVERVVETELSASVILKSGNDWMQIKPGRYGATVKVDPQEGSWYTQEGDNVITLYYYEEG